MTFQTCSYHWTKAKTSDGRTVWYKFYKDPKVRKIKKDQSVFKYNYKEKIYQKYSGILLTDTIHGSTFIQFDSIRIYLFNNTDQFKNIFISKLVSGQMLYCEMDSACRPIPETEFTNVETGKPILRDLWGWTGHTITIDHFEELNYVNSKPTQRRFKFMVFPEKVRFNGYNAVFFLELTNKQADNTFNLETFIAGAKVTFLKNAWSEI